MGPIDRSPGRPEANRDLPAGEVRGSTSSSQVGTCWQGSYLLDEVSCSDDHDYRVSQVVDDPAECPLDYLDGDSYLCLRVDS